ncbi:CLUMA_CG017333, isoform A [Clunio marinus]|uniref:CLUMA_CG017333, isoform A n=1 Tax=Clunio marinus TaxID=568069 RepID=A0A1J1IVD4_9DIPT|nr:CLUMA_CG017333, isoform A [Clunio marinus]
MLHLNLIIISKVEVFEAKYLPQNVAMGVVRPLILNDKCKLFLGRHTFYECEALDYHLPYSIENQFTQLHLTPSNLNNYRVLYELQPLKLKGKRYV